MDIAQLHRGYFTTLSHRYGVRAFYRIAVWRAFYRGYFTTLSHRYGVRASLSGDYASGVV
jgi:hypothetical protein